MFGINVLDLFLTNGFSLLGINISVLACIVTGILVIIIINPIVSVLFLIGLFLGVSLNLMYLGLNFIGLSYLLVYVGAVTILFLFILMLINIRISEIISSTRNSIPLAIAIGLVFFSTLYPSIPLVQNYTLSNPSYNIDNTLINNSFTPDLLFVPGLNHSLNHAEKESLYLSDSTTKYTELDIISFFDVANVNINNVYSNSWDLFISDISHIVTLGNILYTDFPILLLLTSTVLLLSMVGSIIITVKPLAQPNNNQK